MKMSAKRTLKRILFVILFILFIPLLILEGILFLIRKAAKKRKWKKQELDGHKLLMSSSITDIDLMDGYMFEDYLKVLLFYLGYKVIPTNKSHDFGADLIVKNSEDQTIVIQAKRYNKPVGPKAVQEVMTCKKHYKADEAWVISNNKYTNEAETLAKENQVRLIDRNELIEMYSEANKILENQSNDGKLLYQKTDLAEKFPFYI